MKILGNIINVLTTLKEKDLSHVVETFSFQNQLIKIQSSGPVRLIKMIYKFIGSLGHRDIKTVISTSYGVISK